MSERISVAPFMLQWAIDRADKDIATLKNSFPKLEEWINGQLEPTYKQLQDFADAVYIPFGYLFLPEPVVEDAPISDFRTINNNEIHRPSLNLLETIYLCQSRQDWFRDYALKNNLEKVKFVNTATLSDNHIDIARKISQELHISFSERPKMRSSDDLFRFIRGKLEEAGILIMSSSTIGNNLRHLKVEEFRGFALSDEYAPLVFVNSSDHKVAQIFTSIHETAHLWLGESGISNPDYNNNQDKQNEIWCDMVAAEVLVPIEILAEKIITNQSIEEKLNQAENLFHVSRLVLLRRMKEADIITPTEFNNYYKKVYLSSNIRNNKENDGKGDYYRNLIASRGNRFLQSLFVDTLEGRTTYQEAFELTGISQLKTFNKCMERLGLS